jgi:hypothetical protein
MVDGSARTRAATLVRATLSLADAALRASYVASLVRETPVASMAATLDVVCEAAEQAEVPAREALVAIVDALNAAGMDAAVQRLREEAAGASLLALERLVRQPLHERPVEPPPAAILPNDGRSRPLTLGERKSLARRPDRDTMQRLLNDPHPDVIRRCLRNPRMTEDDVVRLGARRPGRGDVLAEIARSRWVHCPRVRIALVLNPATPVEITARIVGLLLRSELAMVSRSPAALASVRALCLEHLDRRPPAAAKSQGTT